MVSPRRTGLGAALLAIGGFAPFAGAGVYLVKDIATQTNGSWPRTITPTQSYLYFTVEHPVFERELWRTDGSAAGTLLLRDIHPTDSSDPMFLAEFGPYVYFVAASETRTYFQYTLPGQEIWRTDGTPEGTVLVADFGDWESVGFPSELTVMGNHIYCASDAYGWGDELWRTDGTPEGFEMVKDISASEHGSLPQMLTASGAALYFTADDGVHGRELWVSRGTEQSTVLLNDITPDGASEILHLTPFGAGVAFFVRVESSGWQLWRSDGTVAGTVPFHTMSFDESRRRPQALFAHDGSLYFPGWDSQFAWEVWRSDGTAGGTFRLTETNGNAQGQADSFLAGPGGVYFNMADPAGKRRLYVTDGSVAGTRVVDSVLTPDHQVEPPIVNAGGRILAWVRDGFYDPEQVWSLSAGNPTLQPSVPLMLQSNGDRSNAAVWNGALYLPSPGPRNDAINHYNRDVELWRTDGTPAGTFQVRNINQTTMDSVPRLLAPAGDRTAFIASSAEFGRELWTTDGTRSGTAQVADLAPGPEDSEIRAIQPFGEGAIFEYKKNVGGSAIWYTDGVTVGPLGGSEAMPAYSFVGGLTSDGGRAFFDARALDGERGLWVIDASPAGARQLAVGKPYYPIAGVNRAFPIAGEYAFFILTHDLGHRELWRTDGTVEGTAMIESFEQEGDHISNELYPAIDSVFFQGQSAETGKAIFVARGDSGGVTPLVSLEAFENYAALDSAGVIEFDGHAYFRIYSRDEADIIYRSDGTPNGTAPFATFTPLSLSQFGFHIHEGYLYYIGNPEGDIQRIWRTDGVSPPAPVSAGVRGMQQPTFLGDRIFCVAPGPNGPRDGNNSRRALWSIDLADGASRLEAEFPLNTAIYEIAVQDGRLLFQADDDIHGIELWAYDANYVPLAADINGDYATDAADVQLILNSVLGLFTGFGADVNGDGFVNAADIQAVINEALGITDSQEKAQPEEVDMLPLLKMESMNRM